MLSYSQHIERFDKAKHKRDQFDCGNDALNTYLKRFLSQGIKQGLVQAYVITELDTSRILAYATLSNASIQREQFDEAQAKRLPNYPIPALLIGRMAVDQKAQQAGLKLGSKLLVHLLKLAVKLSEQTGVMCVIVDAKPEAVGFYEQFGFRRLQGDGNALYLSIKELRKLA